MKAEGIPVKVIKEKLGIKSDSQIYTWWYCRDGELNRLKQPIGKQYSFDHGPKLTIDISFTTRGTK